MNRENIVLTANIRNFRGKVHTRVFSRAMFRRDNFPGSHNPVLDLALHPDNRIILGQGQLVRLRSVLRLFSPATLQRQKRFAK